jgi:hypothetical protein
MRAAVEHNSIIDPQTVQEAETQERLLQLWAEVNEEPVTDEAITKEVKKDLRKRGMVPLEEASKPRRTRKPKNT